MDEEFKKGLKRIARDTEIKVAESILRWKVKKEGGKMPDDQHIQRQSTVIADQAHRIISKRGRNIWNQLKGVYRKEQKEGSSDD